MTGTKKSSKEKIKHTLSDQTNSNPVINIPEAYNDYKNWIKREENKMKITEAKKSVNKKKKVKVKKK